MTPERRREVLAIAHRYGSPNCWTGTAGMLSAIIRECLEVSKIRSKIDSAAAHIVLASERMQAALSEATELEAYVALNLLEDCRKLERLVAGFASSLESKDED